MWKEIVKNIKLLENIEGEAVMWKRLKALLVFSQAGKQTYSHMYFNPYFPAQWPSK